MLHDFILSEKFAVVPDLPLEFSPPDAVKYNQFAWKFNKGSPCRYGFLDRRSLDTETMIWIDVDPHYIFHFVNAWDDTN